MNEIENIYVLTNKMERKDFFCIHDNADYWLFVVFQSPILFSYDNIEFFPVNKNSIILYPPKKLQCYKSNDDYFINSFLILNTKAEYFDEFSFPVNKPFTLSQEQINNILLILDGISFIKNTQFFPEKRVLIPDLIHNLFKTIQQAFNSTQLNDSIVNMLHSIKTDMINDPISNTVSKLAQKSGYSEPYFCKIYREQFGSTPGYDRQKQILKKIKQYLETTNLSLETIAELCGMASVPFLIKIFKKSEGLTPHQYRIKMKNKS